MRTPLKGLLYDAQKERVCHRPEPGSWGPGSWREEALRNTVGIGSPALSPCAPRRVLPLLPQSAGASPPPRSLAWPHSQTLLPLRPAVPLPPGPVLGPQEQTYVLGRLLLEHAPTLREPRGNLTPAGLEGTHLCVLRGCGQVTRPLRVSVSSQNRTILAS